MYRWHQDPRPYTIEVADRVYCRHGAGSVIKIYQDRHKIDMAVIKIDSTGLHTHHPLYEVRLLALARVE